MKKLWQQGLLSALVISITACGGSSHSKAVSTATSSTITSSSVAASSQAALSTVYTVSVDVPLAFSASPTAAITLPQTLSEFFIASAHADAVSQLTAANFAVVIVDLAGKVLERVPLTDSDITKNSDGSWSLTVPGDPRLDCVIVADVTKPIVLAAEGNINQDGFVFAPTTAASVDIDVGSTAAYKNFIEELGGSGTFAESNINPTDTKQIKAVENLVNSIQTVVQEQTLTNYANISDALAALKTTVSDSVKQEVENVKKPAEGTVATLIRDEGGLYWFDGAYIDDIAYGGIKGTEEEVSYSYDGKTFVKDTEVESEGQFVLSSKGWVLASDKINVVKFNDDGTVLLQDSLADGAQEIASVTQVFDLAGRNVSKYLAASVDTALLAKLTNPDTVFAAGAKGYRIQISLPTKTYSIYSEPGDDEGVCRWNKERKAEDTGGNCNVLMLHKAGAQEQFLGTDLSTLFSQDVALNAEGSVTLDIGTKGEIGVLKVQLLNNEAKTTRFYVQTWAATSGETELLGEGTWSEITLPTLAADAGVIHIQLPKAVAAVATLWNESTDFYIVKHQGFLRELQVDEAGVKSNDAGAVFNGAARDNILTALDYIVPPTLLPTATIAVDGSDADWLDVATYLVDATGDQKGTSSADLTQVSVAKSGDKLAVLMKVAGDIAFPYAPTQDYSHYEVALHFFTDALCMGESGGYLVVNNFTSATGQNVHALDTYYGGQVMGDSRPTEVASAGHVLESSFYVDYLPEALGDYMTVTSVVHSFVGNQTLDHDLNSEQKTCLKVR